VIAYSPVKEKPWCIFYMVATSILHLKRSQPYCLRPIHFKSIHYYSFHYFYLLNPTLPPPHLPPSHHDILSYDWYDIFDRLSFIDHAVAYSFTTDCMVSWLCVPKMIWVFPGGCWLAWLSNAPVTFEYISVVASYDGLTGFS